MPSDLAEIRAIVETGDFDRLVGKFEGQHLDAKAQPYLFNNGNDAKREFAKDVAAFANASGGCIIIGAETTLSNLRAGEQITAIKPFPETIFNTDQYGKILDEWLYPVPSGLVIEWHPAKGASGSGMGVILIPMQDPQVKPFLLTRTLADKKTTEILLGYAERRLDRTDIKSVVELHHQVRTGMNLEATLLSRITSLEVLLQRQLARSPILQPSSAASEAATSARVARILAQSQLVDRRTLTAIIAPVPRSELRSIFSEHPNGIRRALENPPELRVHGWGIGTGGAAQLIDGDFIQTEGGSRVIDLYRDGELIAATRIDRNSLAWADNADIRIHPLAFVEFVANTLGFYTLVLSDMRVMPDALQIEIRLANLIQNGEATALPAGQINNMGWTFGSKPAPGPAWSRSITVEASPFDPARAAFLILREVYVWFGHPEEDVPYTVGTGDQKVIDTKAIAGIS